MDSRQWSKIFNRLNNDKHLNESNVIEKLRMELLRYDSLYKKWTKADYDINHGMDSDGSTLLHYAAENGSAIIVNALLNAGADANKADKKSSVPLHWAAYNGHNETVQVLIGKGAQVDKINARGRTPLHYAAIRSHLDVIRYLIDEHGAEFTIEDSDRNTAFHCAVRQGDLNVVKYLVEEKHADVLQAEKVYGVTPVGYAAIFNNLEILKYLVNKAPVSIHTRDYEGKIPLHLAANGKGTLDMVVFLVNKGSKVDAVCFSGRTPVQNAIYKGKLDVVKYLVEVHGANLDTRNKCGHSPLFTAIECGYLDIVKYLMQHAKLDVDSTDISGRTLLHSVAHSGNIDLVKYLIDELGLAKHINVQRTDNGWTALREVVSKGYHESALQHAILNFERKPRVNKKIMHESLEIIKLLISRGADVDIKDNGGQTSLHIAAGMDRLDIVKILVTKGADINMQDDEGRTPLYVATSSDGTFDTVEFLVTKGANVDSANSIGRTSVQGAIYTGKLDIVKYLVEVHGANLDTRDKYGNSPLFTATEHGHVHIVKYLIQNTKPNIDIINIDGRTVLHLAVHSGNISLIKYLIDQVGLAKHINVQRKDNGWTVLHEAVSKDYQGTVEFHAIVNSERQNKEARPEYLEIIKLLINRGADIDVKDKNGSTPLHVAARIGRLDIVQILVTNDADINVQNDNNNTPKALAIKCSRKDIVKYFESYNLNQ